MILTVILCLQFYCASGDLSRHDIIHNLLREPKYDPLIAPNYEDDFPTNISVQLIIKNIHSLDELHMDFSVDVIFRQQWVDKRLVFNHTKVSSLELDQKMIEKIWVPDSFFPKEKRAKIHDVTVPNRLLHIYKNGTVFYSMRIEMTLSCAMVLQNYPLDRQVCPITIESFGDFACLLLELRFERNTGYYISQIFIPSILIVVLSWVSFWVDIDAIPARVSLGVLTVLTMTTQSSGARSALPRVSYIKAIDVWMAVCLTFVFMALLEFAYINVVSRRKSRPVSTNSQCQMVLKKGMSPSPMMPILKHIDFKKRARHVDKIARVMFPLIFFLFNIGFWVFYLSINTENKF
ncbi:glycine receptor subunit alpha-2-like isoform X2 [Ostrea edulis]|uniref:glycine receptor subunit alpha-2-like isoform X2 n=1 Tax=Ostrea edulis TaxID=37623 RepID=UPI0024AF3ACC|nr:glycine receptor subunit alpha-2-like isoform X2 [Ostrea edulis]